MQAYESIRYNDGKGTVKSKSYSVYGTDGQLLRQTPYSFTYGDPSKGEIPDALYKFETSGGSYSYAYDRLARLESRTLTVGNTVKTESYTYAANPANSAFTTPLVSSMTDLAGKTHTYTYDANGNILTDTYDGNTVSYEYDSLNRMTRYNDPVFGRTYVYVYDDRGNITEMQDHSYTTGALSAYYGSCEYEYGDGTWADLMTSYWGEDIAYDELGNPLNWINGETLTWQNGRRLASVDGTTYGYNADGLRVSKAWALGSTEYYVVDGQYIGEKTVKNGTQYFITYTYDENGAPAGINVNGTQYWFVKNLQGDVTAILDSTGAVAANYRYDAYGYIISITNGSGANVGLTDTGHIARLNPFRYRGYMYDEETGYYYVSSRYYEPYIGRFLNADTTNILTVTPNGLTDKNLFSYCDGNPVMRVDYSGEFWNVLVGAIVGGLTSFISAVVDEATDNEDKNKFEFRDWMSIVASTIIGAAEGAAIAICPAAGAAIGAAAGAADAVITGLIDGDSAKEIIIDTAISGGLGAVTGAGGGSFRKGGKLINEAGSTIMQKNVRPLAKKAGKKLRKKAFKYIARAGAKDMAESLAYWGIEKGTSKFTKSYTTALERSF